jgi:hypothetical protein
MADPEDSDFDDALSAADIQDLIHGNVLRQPGESLVDQEADQDAVEGIRHLLIDCNEGEVTEDELTELIGRVTKRHIFPLHGTDGFLGNMHTSKVVIVVGVTGDDGRLCIYLKQELKCIQGLQCYNSSTRNDLKKQSRPSLDLKVKKLGSLVSFYFTPYKTQAETARIPGALRNIRATLRLLKEALTEQNNMAESCHRRPVRLELFYNECADSFFTDELLFPTTTVSIAEGIVQVAQDEVISFHHAVNAQVIIPLLNAFGTIDTADHAPEHAALDAEEKTYLSYAAEAAAVMYGCSQAEGPVFRTLRLNGWKSPLTFQPHSILRLQARQETFLWCKLPYRLRTCVRPCAFETGRCLGNNLSTELREKEMRKLQQDIAVQMKKEVRIPYMFAKTKACVLGLLHQYGKSESESESDSESASSSRVDDTDSHLNTPGLFDDIKFKVLAQLQDADRRQFLCRAVDSILDLYSAEWRDILDRKLIHFRQRSITSPRRRIPTRRECALPSNIEMPVSMSGVDSLRTAHGESCHLLSRSAISAITDATGKSRRPPLIF